MTSSMPTSGTTTEVDCSWCGNTAIYMLSAGDRNRRLSNERFRYYRCLRCGFMFLWPIPEDLGSYYPSGYYMVPSSLDELAYAANLERYKIDLVTPFVRGGRLLEIGPAYGSFVLLAQQAGFVVDAIEMDSDCCRFLSEVVGVRALQSDDPSNALATLESYDVIALWQVVEHLPDPLIVLQTAARHLKPGGVLVVAAPNPDAFQFRLFGARWTHLDAPRHVGLIPMAALVQLMDKEGLSCMLRTTNDTGSLAWNTFGWQMSLRNGFRFRPMRLAMRLFGRVISFLARPVERIEGQGCTYTLVFRKERTS